MFKIYPYVSNTNIIMWLIVSMEFFFFSDGFNIFFFENFMVI